MNGDVVFRAKGFVEERAGDVGLKEGGSFCRLEFTGWYVRVLGFVDGNEDEVD